MQILVHSRGGQLVNIPAGKRVKSSRAIEIAIRGLDRRVYGLGVAVDPGEVVLICKHSGWGQLENATIASRIREASSVEISVAAKRQPREAATPTRRKIENDAFRSARRNLIDCAGAIGPTAYANPVHIAVAALYDVVFGFAGVSRNLLEAVQRGGSLRLRGNVRGEYADNREQALSMPADSDGTFNFPWVPEGKYILSITDANYTEPAVAANAANNSPATSAKTHVLANREIPVLVEDDLADLAIPLAEVPQVAIPPR